MIVRPAVTSDAAALMRWVVRHMGESGGEDRELFHPFEDFELWDLKAKADEVAPLWTLPVTQPGWARAWIFDDHGVIRGEGNLRGSPLDTALHRCSVSLGVLEESREQGYGRRILETIIQWARKQDSLFWMDAFVFSHNEPARLLFESLGFQAYGMTMDAYRVHGQSIDLLHLSLQLREE